MKIVILTPGIKSAGDIPASLHLEGASLVYATNPLYQNAILRSLSVKTVVDDDISDCDEDFDRLAKQAEYFARNWFLIPGIQESLYYRGINLGSIFTYWLTYNFIAFLNAHYLYEKLCKKFSPKEIYIVDDKSSWVAAAKFIAPFVQTKINFITNESVEISNSPNRASIGSLKAYFVKLNKIITGHSRTGGVLYSCALKFALPLLQNSRDNYYLRDVFSIKAFLLSKKYHFSYLQPQYFDSKESRPKDMGQETTLDLSLLYRKIDSFFTSNNFFFLDDRNFWPLFRERFDHLIKNEFLTAISQIDSFQKLIQKLKPSTVVVDEDVLEFNKTLVLCAKSQGVRTCTMIHGIPFANRQSIPVSSDYVLAWGSSTKNRLAGWGVEKDKIIETGATQYENYKKMDHSRIKNKIYSQFRIDKRQKLITYPMMYLRTNELPVPKYSRTSAFLKIVGGTLNIAIGFLETFSGADLIIKFHPAEQNSWFAEKFAEGFPEGVRSRIHFSRDCPAPSLIAASDLVLSMASTVYYEALILKKPVMLFDYSDKRFCDFMSSFYLDIHNPALCYEKIRHFLTGGERIVLERQEQEIHNHFYQSNINAVQNTLRLVKSG